MPPWHARSAVLRTAAKRGRHLAEPTLSLSYNDLLGEVGLFLGWGRGAANGEEAWDAHKTAVVESSVRSGLRQFYFPPPPPGQESPMTGRS